MSSFCNHTKPLQIARMSLADGSRWAIQAGHWQANGTVARLGLLMGLRLETTAKHAAAKTDRDSAETVAVCSDSASACRRLIINEGQESDSSELFLQALPRLIAALERDEPVVCNLQTDTEDKDLLYVQLMFALMLPACSALAGGGLLLHRALAVRDDLSNGEQGVILAGMACAGKSTASRRLPPPWRSLCDDTVLVLRDAQGRYQAHPWPTWSRFFFGGPGGSWDVQSAVPLRAIFLLEQSPEDRAEPVGAGEAMTYLAPSAEQIWRAFLMRLDDDDKARKIRMKRFDNLSALARTVPSYRLRLSLEGSFWEAMEARMNENQNAGNTLESE